LRRDGTRRVVVIAGAYYAVLEELDVAEVLLEVEGEAKERLRGVVRRMKDARRAGRRAGGKGSLRVKPLVRRASRRVTPNLFVPEERVRIARCQGNGSVCD
jgi:hypothetical protein